MVHTSVVVARYRPKQSLWYFCQVDQKWELKNQIKKILFMGYIYILFLAAILKSRNLKRGESWSAHTLVVGNSQYIDLAKVACYSFLANNRGISVTIHTDNSLVLEVSNSFTYAIRRGLVVVKAHKEWEGKSWQYCKLELLEFVGMNCDLYFDADTRWFTEFSPTPTPIFLVKEYLLVSRFPYRDFVKAKYPEMASSISMLNTSVVCFGSEGRKTQALTREIWNIYFEYLKFLDDLDLGEIDEINSSRLSEQLAVSIGTQLMFSEISPLKESDLIRDRKIVDSCYFGATGSKYFRVQAT